MQVMWVIHWGTYISTWVIEQKNVSFSIGKHNKDKHSTVPKDLEKQFSVLKKCNDKFDCLVREMLLIRELTSSLHVQSDWIREKLFAWLLHISYMLIIARKNLFDSLSASILNLEMASRWHWNVISFLPALFLTCFYKIIMALPMQCTL